MEHDGELKVDEQAKVWKILACYFEELDKVEKSEVCLQRLNGGMNNSTYRLRIKDHKYVLRLYESHQDVEKVQYEHAVLSSLLHIKRAFEIPELVHTIEGETMAYDDKKIAALFRYKEGRNPRLASPQQFRKLGERSGQLSLALSRADISLKPAYPPYYRLDISYPECTPEYLISTLNRPDPVFIDDADVMKQTAKPIEQIFKRLSGLDHIPHQIVHGDINASNVLENEHGEIYAILDFEFATLDARVMELAVPLSDMIGSEEEAIWEQCSALVSGFTSIINLSKEERALIPTLILLRRLDVVMHFMSRWKMGIDPVSIVKRQIHELYARLKWMDKHEGRLLKILYDGE